MPEQSNYKALKKALFAYSRLLHVYLSTFLLTLLILFSITGITLNHRWYDSDNNKENRIEKEITTELKKRWLGLSDSAKIHANELQNSAAKNINTTSIGKPAPEQESEHELDKWNPELTLITLDLRREFLLPVPSSIELEHEFKEVMFDFKVPAGFATVTLLFEESKLIFEQEEGSLIAVLNDLHKGRHSGEAWSWVIDVSAVLIIFFSITGFIILFQGKKHRTAGVLSFLLGTVSPYFIYLFLVPVLGA